MKTRESERKMRMGCKKLVCALLSCTMLCACTSTKSVEKQSNKKQYVKTDQFTSALIDSTDYKGKWIKIEGKVKLGPEVSGKQGYLVKYVPAQRRYFFFKTDKDLGYQPGDYVKVEGQIGKDTNLVNSSGNALSITTITHAKVSDGSYKDVEVPTYCTNKPKEPKQTIDGITMKVSKVEYANQETRVYVSIENNSDQPIYYDPNYIILQQDGTHINSDVLSSSYEKGNYPQLANAIEPHSKTSGIVVFSVISSEKDCDVITTLFTANLAGIDFTIHVNA